MIYDCFTFFNELDLLEIRLNVLNDVVDKFVIVEATKTFTNNDKPLYFNENKDRFAKFKDKIIHIIVDTYPVFDNAWTFEYHQRNTIAKGLLNCKDNDVVLISDIDEIPNPIGIKKYKDYEGVKVFKQKMFYYFINNINVTKPYWVDLATKMLSYADFKKRNSNVEKIRFSKGLLIHNGGWHFSYLGGVEAIALKIRSFAHQEYNLKEFASVENIRMRIKNGEDLFFEKNKNKFSAISIDDSFPEYILKNQEKYKNLICEVNITNIGKLKLRLNLLKYDLILYLKQVRNKLLNKY